MSIRMQLIDEDAPILELSRGVICDISEDK